MTVITEIGFGKKVRLNRLTQPGDGLFLVPMDHSITTGPIMSADELNRVVRTVSECGADGVVLHQGRARFLDAELFRNLSLIVHLSASTSQAPDTDEKVLVAAVEQAVELGADAASIHVNLGSDTESKQLADLGRVADRCRRWGMPLLVMIYPRGPRIANPADPALVAHAANVAADLGADIVKTLYTGSVETMAEVVESCPIPVIAAGGAPVGTEAHLYRSIRDIMRSGTAGVAVGRNVFLADDVARTTRGIADIVHGSKTDHIDTHDTNNSGQNLAS
ncbi:2-amino-3,7-dideoxy-D-threo-hept-6-ulosonate synthase [Streptomyces antimycoticus]|uniref:2-amino-3,7-dideoxy-D-threo-hept-6-ulosonate synthase n=1 Tax=Streptomyces antimycoticus TaxID=68175 RepID=UPI000A3C91F6|nr:2-amino-3,7-dideoxy-D-threo-hept-6-ulosonate synthase [Streptomyces antimycoticus]